MAELTQKEKDRLWRDLDIAAKDLMKGQTARSGGVGAEKRYGQAYKRLVQAGLAPKLRKKYTIGGLASN